MATELLLLLMLMLSSSSLSLLLSLSCLFYVLVKSFRRKFAARPPGVPWIWMSSPRATPQYETESAATAMPRLVWKVGPEGTPSG